VLAAGLVMLCKSQHIAEIESSSKNFLAILERDLPGIIAIQIQQIEDVDAHGNPAEQVD
jgi:hypothetical protein